MGSTFTKTDSVKMETGYGIEEQVPFYLQFVPGTVVEVVTYAGSFKGNGDFKNINTIMAKPHITETIPPRRNAVMHNEKYRYKPLMRGFTDVPAKGDPVLLCTIGKENFYLGPLNYDNNPNWNDDKLFQHERVHLKTPSNEALRNEKKVRGESLNFYKEEGVGRLSKVPNPTLDFTPFKKDKAINETHGDMMFEGRHGNSIRIGSRANHPYVFISNNRSLTESPNDFKPIQESHADGSLISITSSGTLKNHLGLAYDHQKALRYPFILSSELDVQESNWTIHKMMIDLMLQRNKAASQQDPLYDYQSDQILITSDRLIFDAKNDNVIISSYEDIHLGAKNNVTISTNRGHMYCNVNSFSIGNPMNVDTQPMVLGDQLYAVLNQIAAVIKEAHFMCQGVALPLVDANQFPLTEKIAEIENQIPGIRSQYHEIESNNRIKAGEAR